MADTIFARVDGQLTALGETPFALEDDLQALVAQHPQLLAGAQMDPAAPRRFVLVAREVPVPDRAEASSGRWSLDHLFVDQDAVPTLVEAKRAVSTQLRREVVGQMLDYAANAVRFWSADELEQAFHDTHGPDAPAALHDHIGYQDHAAFWREVESNLGDVHIRLLFVADRIPAELQGIIEFLNERTAPLDVLAVEIKQYYASPTGPQVLVPRLIGMTAVARGTKRSSASYEELTASADPHTRQVEQRLLDWAERHGLATSRTAKSLRISRGETPLARLYPQWATLELPLQALHASDPEQAQQLLELMRARVSKPLTDKYPQIPTDEIVDRWDEWEREILDRFLRARTTANHR